ncbi:MAG TPA: hypothetical protein VHC47_07295 [Mucilaginibacter sp.]|nr:hypothetical protein [Mucilaginibacter sp.]
MKAKTAVIIATAYLVLYAALFQAGLNITVLSILFLFSPLIIIWVVYIVLKDDSAQYPELKEDEEWGYTDVSKDHPGMF